MKETGDSKYVYQNELDKACFQHDMAYGHFKDLPRRTTAGKVLHDKAFNTAKNPKNIGYICIYICIYIYIYIYICIYIYIYIYIYIKIQH